MLSSSSTIIPPAKLNFIDNFKTNTIQQRQTLSKKLTDKYKNNIPVVIDRYDDKTPAIDRHKFLIPYTYTVAEILMVIRKRIKLNSSESIVLFTNNVLHSSSTLLSVVYDRHKNTDGFLYIIYQVENTFG